MILWFSNFLGGIVARYNAKDVNISMLLSTVAIFGVADVCRIALIANISVTLNVGVPTLQFA